ncbi:hypothetical protein LEP1GSC079_1196 [Leptospira interrogans str. FPW1039]|uniref:Uncharacterized protein n=1 Tax=Leptospira interrogans str. FPW1039 TaxID=1193040 RepID=A0A0F6IDW2_LEPIR|nr:hypothetical protein LEP1GSC079_1196 [Leptospira interrogans str. FPW1039]
MLLGVNPGFHGEYLNDPDRNMDESPLKSWLVDKKNENFQPGNDGDALVVVSSYRKK